MGWILRNFDYEGRDRWDSDVKPYTDDGNPWPWLEITGLVEEPLELVWFDDRRGVIIGRQPVSGSTIQVELPDMDPDDQPYRQFFKSLAFIIQPPGYTPEKDFAPLPSETEPIGQILIDTVDTGTPDQPIELPTDWHAESADFDPIEQPQPYRYVVKTKPPLTNPGAYYYCWEFEGLSPVSDYGLSSVEDITIPAGSAFKKISVDIYPDELCNENERISGDVIYVRQ